MDKYYCARKDKNIKDTTFSYCTGCNVEGNISLMNNQIIEKDVITCKTCILLKEIAQNITIKDDYERYHKAHEILFNRRNRRDKLERIING